MTANSFEELFMKFSRRAERLGFKLIKSTKVSNGISETGRHQITCHRFGAPRVWRAKKGLRNSRSKKCSCPFHINVHCTLTSGGIWSINPSSRNVFIHNHKIADDADVDGSETEVEASPAETPSKKYRTESRPSLISRQELKAVVRGPKKKEFADTLAALVKG